MIANKMMIFSFPSLVTLSTALATNSISFESNLNYHSPSRRHENLGITIPLVSRRSLKRGAVPYKPSELHFTHGIASGDPYPDSVILWTRLAPSNASDKSNVTVEGTVDLYNHETEQYIKADPSPICADWKVWEAQGGASPVVTGTAYTTSDIDFTIKVSNSVIEVSSTGCNNKSPGGSKRIETIYSLQLPVCHLRLQLYQPRRQDQDVTIA